MKDDKYASFSTSVQSLFLILKSSGSFFGSKLGFGQILEILYDALDGVHAFNYNSTGVNQFGWLVLLSVKGSLKLWAMVSIFSEWFTEM